MVVAPSTGEGRWHRVWESGQPLNVKWFGAKSDVILCQAEGIKRAMNYLQSNANSGTIYLPAGSYYISGDNSIPTEPNINIKGAGNDQTKIWSDNGGRYLLNRRHGTLNITISDLAIENPTRLILMYRVSNITFENVRFLGGFTRFEDGEHIVINNSIFYHNTGKAAYASHGCSYVTLTNNLVINPAEGGLNISGHQNSYVANNKIISDKNINSGYAGIRLPNDAYNNVVENNLIIRTGRGIFVLTGSKNNIIRNNEVRETTSQGFFIQSSNNTFDGNTIIDAGDESIYVINSDTENKPSPSDNNVIKNNIILDTKRHNSDRFIALKIYGAGNQVLDNIVSSTYGRKFKNISSSNTDRGNIYERR